MKSFICFSSGVQKRYRDDIIRAMAMPSGCELTFRYRLKYLSATVQDYLANKRISAGDQVLISFLDQSERSKPVFFIPVRFATIIEVPTIGDFAVLRMRVEQYAYSPDLDAFNRDIQTFSEAPAWRDATSPYATGSFWIEVAKCPQSVLPSTSDSDWQFIVGQLLARKDFANAGPFYQVARLQEFGSKQAVTMSEGQFALRPNSEYELLIDHFFPRAETGAFELNVLVTGQAIMFITGSKIQIDSPYDRRWLRFKTQEPLRDERVVATITKTEDGGGATAQFDIPISVAGRRLKAIVTGVLFGVLLALPHVITIWVNPSFASRSPAWFMLLGGFIAIVNIGVGIGAALNFRKPI